VGRADPRPDTTNASGVRTLVPAGAWRGSSARGGHTARASSRALLQTCIPTPRTERHTPVPREVCAVSHLPSPHSTGPGRPRQRAPRAGGGPDTQVRPRSGTTPPISVASPRNWGFAEAVCGPQCAFRFRARSRIRARPPGRALLRMLLRSTPGRARSRNSPTIEVDQLERSTGPACAVPQNTAIWDSGAINAARQPEPVFGVLGANDVNLRR
jgi:hypothetical protein